MNDGIQVKGRHVTQHPGPLEAQTVAANWYAEAHEIVVDGKPYILVRVDDALHPDFWLEVSVPVQRITAKS